MDGTTEDLLLEIEAALRTQADFYSRNQFLELGIDPSLVHRLLRELSTIQRVLQTVAPQFTLALGAPAANDYWEFLNAVDAYEKCLQHTLQGGRGSVENTNRARTLVNIALNSATSLIRKEKFPLQNPNVGGQEHTIEMVKETSQVWDNASSGSAQYPRDKLLEILIKRFNKEEIRHLIFLLGIDHEELGLSQGKKSALARDLIEYTERRNRYAELVHHIDKFMPGLLSQYYS